MTCVAKATSDRDFDQASMGLGWVRQHEATALQAASTNVGANAFARRFEQRVKIPSGNAKTLRCQGRRQTGVCQVRVEKGTNPSKHLSLGRWCRSGHESSASERQCEKVQGAVCHRRFQAMQRRRLLFQRSEQTRGDSACAISAGHRAGRQGSRVHESGVEFCATENAQAAAGRGLRTLWRKAHDCRKAQTPEGQAWLDGFPGRAPRGPLARNPRRTTRDPEAARSCFVRSNWIGGDFQKSESTNRRTQHLRTEGLLGWCQAVDSSNAKTLGYFRLEVSGKGIRETICRGQLRLLGRRSSLHQENGTLAGRPQSTDFLVSAP